MVRPYNSAVDAFLTATGLVALAEMGDKTQLLALLLSLKFCRPWPIVAGIFVATLANHALAGTLGAWLAHWLNPAGLRWLLGVSFLGMAAWVLIPDRVDEDIADRHTPRWGVFGTTVVAYFLAEMGDKTQIATIALAAQHGVWAWVVAGSTLGLLLATAPVVWLGGRLLRHIPLRLVHRVSAALFALLGLAVLFGWGG